MYNVYSEALVQQLGCRFSISKQVKRDRITEEKVDMKHWDTLLAFSGIRTPADHSTSATLTYQRLIAMTQHTARSTKDLKLCLRTKKTTRHGGCPSNPTQPKLAGNGRLLRNAGCTVCCPGSDNSMHVAPLTIIRVGAPGRGRVATLPSCRDRLCFTPSLDQPTL